MDAPNPARQSRERGASRTPPPTAAAKRRLRHSTRRVRFPHASKWCAGCARGIGCVGRRTRGRRTVGDVGAAGQAQRLRLTQPGNPANAGRRGRRPLRAGARRRLRHSTRRMRFPHASKWCAGCARGIAYVGQRTQGGRTEGDAVKIGQAECLRLTRPSGHANAVHRGRCTLRATAKPNLRHET